MSRRCAGCRAVGELPYVPFNGDKLHANCGGILDDLFPTLSVAPSLDPDVAKAVGATWPSAGPHLMGEPRNPQASADEERRFNECFVRNLTAENGELRAENNDLRAQLAGDPSAKATQSDVAAERDYWRELALDLEASVTWHKREFARGKR